MWTEPFKRDGEPSISTPSTGGTVFQPAPNQRAVRLTRFGFQSTITLKPVAMAQEEKKKKLNIDLPEELASGTYSNLAVITHSPVEFVVDFAQVMPGMNQAQVRSRIILAPHHAKRLLHALSENVKRFEQQQGPIQPPKGNQDPAMPLTFSGPQGEA